MKKFLIFLWLSVFSASMMAQPTRRRTTTSNEAAQREPRNNVQASDRFSLSFPTSGAMPEDVAWRRDVYRELDLTKDKNAPLYYPVTPIGNQCNLFTYLFRLLISGRVNAYQYNVVTSVESFDEKDKINLKDFLDDNGIRKQPGRDGKFVVEDADIPSGMVKRYRIKESSYLDQRTGTTHTKVTAICPILVEGDGEFGDPDEYGDAADYSTAKALFWMKYDDVAPYLSKLPVMASDLNNVTNMTADDYFTLNHYDGKIFMTNNMQGKSIQQYCKTDSAVAKEQKRIEKQLVDFEEHLWGHVEQNDSVDSLQVAAAKPEKKTAKTASTVRKDSRTRRTNSKSEKAEAASTAPRSSARRQRR